MRAKAHRKARAQSGDDAVVRVHRKGPLGIVGHIEGRLAAQQPHPAFAGAELHGDQAVGVQMHAGTVRQALLALPAHGRGDQAFGAGLAGGGQQQPQPAANDRQGAQGGQGERRGAPRARARAGAGMGGQHVHIAPQFRLALQNLAVLGVLPQPAAQCDAIGRREPAPVELIVQLHQPLGGFPAHLVAALKGHDFGVFSRCFSHCFSYAA